ncbi:MAG: hypothetical protein U0869_07095 [Chloroflexota bacterium]
MVIAETVLRLPAWLDGLAELPVPVDPHAVRRASTRRRDRPGHGRGIMPFLIGGQTWRSISFRVRQLPDAATIRPNGAARSCPTCCSLDIAFVTQLPGVRSTGR